MNRKIQVYKLEDELEGLCTLYTFEFLYETPLTSEYQKFWNKFSEDPKVQWDFDVIDQRITKIIEFGAEDEHFRHEFGKVKALPVETSLLRLYCYRLDSGILILGNGGIKKRNHIDSKNKLSNFPQLETYAKAVRNVGKTIADKISKKEILRNGNELSNLSPFDIEIP